MARLCLIFQGIFLIAIVFRGECAALRLVRTCGSTDPLNPSYNCTHNMDGRRSKTLTKEVEFKYETQNEIWDKIRLMESSQAEQPGNQTECPSLTFTPETYSSENAFCSWQYRCTHDNHRIPTYIYHAIIDAQLENRMHQVNQGPRQFQCKPIKTLVNTLRLKCSNNEEKWVVTQEQVVIGYQLVRVKKQV